MYKIVCCILFTYGGINLSERFAKKWENTCRFEKEKKPLTKARLIDMQVISSDGNIVGKVLDIAHIVGKVGMSLIVETKKGENAEFAWDSIQGAGDYVLLKPQ